MTRRNVGLVELLVELVEHHGVLILHVVVSRVMLVMSGNPGNVMFDRKKEREGAGAEETSK